MSNTLKKFCLIALIVTLGGLAVIPSSIAEGAPGGCYFREDSHFLYAGNDYLEIVFNSDKGGVYSILDKATGTDFIKDKEAWWSLYDFYFSSNDEPQYVGGAQASNFSYQSNDIENGLTLNLTWTDFYLDRPLNFEVKVSITIYKDSPLTDWTIGIDNHEDLAIEGVYFPAINGVGQISQDPSNDYLVYPSMSGLLFQDPVHNFKKNTGWGWEMYYPSGWANMQFIAYYSSENHAGLYLAASDTQGYDKFFSVGRPEDWINFSIRYTPTFSSGSSVHVPYSLVVGIFSGDWYSAAQIYRKWAVNQWWCNQGTIYRRADTPSLYKKMASLLTTSTHLRTVNVVNNGTVPEIVKEATDYLDMPVMVSWWGWEKDGWYENYPEVLPPYKGWEFFDTTVNGLNQNQGYFLACICTDFYSMDIPSWDTAKQYAIKNKDGSYVVIKLGSPLVTTYALMDPSTEFFQDTISSLSMALIDHGVNFLWMDGFPLTSPHLRYDSDGSHPIGGGNWWFLGYKQMFENIREKAKEANPNFAMTGEGMAEVYIPYFDSFNDPTITGISPFSFDTCLNDTSKVNFVPLWDVVYHDYITTYSTHVFIVPQEYKAYRDFYTWGLGTNLIRGKILNVWADLKDFTQYDANMADYYRRAVQARFSYASQFLIYGQMLRSSSIKVPEFLIQGAKEIPYTLNDYPPFISPSVLTSTWKAPSGDVGYIFTNISPDQVSFRLEISPSEILLPPKGPYTIIENRNGSPTTLQTDVNLPQTLDIQIEPSDLLLIKIVPSDEVMPPTAVTDNAANITTASVTLNGTLSDLGTAGAARVYFEWGLDNGYANNTTPEVLIHTGTFSFNISGLHPDTTYYFRVKAMGDNVDYGNNSTFKTSAVEVPTPTPTPTHTPTPTPTPTPAAGNKTNIGIIVAPIIALIVIALVVYWFLRRRSKPRTGPTQGPKGEGKV